MGTTGKALLQRVKHEGLRSLIAQVMATPGWEVSEANNGNIAIYPPNGDVMQVHCSPSGMYGGVMDVRRRLRSRGWRPPIGKDYTKRKERMRQVREEEAAAMAAAEERHRREETEHADVEAVVGVMTAPTEQLELPENWDPTFRLRWALAPEGPPEVDLSAAAAKAHATKVRNGTLVTGSALAAKEAKEAKEVAPPVHAHSAAKLRATSFDDLIAEEPPKVKSAAKAETEQRAIALVLDLVTQVPGQWRKLPDLTTPNAASYLRDAAKELGVKLTTRFVKTEGNLGYQYVKAEEVPS